MPANTPAPISNTQKLAIAGFVLGVITIVVLILLNR
jgi:hypothetical protein